VQMPVVGLADGEAGGHGGKPSAPCTKIKIFSNFCTRV
jgi:hypothetical protein